MEGMLEAERGLDLGEDVRGRVVCCTVGKETLATLPIPLMIHLKRSSEMHLHR